MPRTSKKIDISVVIPAYNEERLLGSALKSLKNQTFCGNYEIIVVDNNSTDKTIKIAKEMGVKVVFESQQGVAFARERGFRAAKGKIIASTDADTIVPCDWLEKIYETFQRNSNTIGIMGKIEFFGEKSFKVAIVNLFTPFIEFISWLLCGGGCFWGVNFAIKKDIFLRAGGFNTRVVYGEDLELGLRAKKYGKIIFDNKLTIATSARRYKNIKLSDLAELAFINFFFLRFSRKSYIKYFQSVRDFPNFEITAKKYKKISLAIGVFLFAIFISVDLLYLAINPHSQAFGKTYWREKTHDKVIALTFDDGPNEPYTSEILDILNHYQIKATFFEVGKNIEYYPKTTNKLFEDGQIIANHSYSHQRDLLVENKKTIEWEIGKTQEIIRRITGKEPHLFRPPYGYKSPMLLGGLKEFNLLLIEWSDMTNDYYKPGTENIVKKIVAKAKPGGIIALHDGDETKHGSDRFQTVKALPKIIEGLQRQGYQFVTVPELLGVPAYNN